MGQNNLILKEKREGEIFFLEKTIRRIGKRKLEGMLGKGRQSNMLFKNIIGRNLDKCMFQETLMEKDRGLIIDKKRNNYESSEIESKNTRKKFGIGLCISDKCKWRSVRTKNESGNESKSERLYINEKLTNILRILNNYGPNSIKISNSNLSKIYNRDKRDNAIGMTVTKK